MKRIVCSLAVCGVAACDPTGNFTVDGSVLAEDHPTATLVTELVEAGITQHRVELDLSVETSFYREDIIDNSKLTGIISWADLDGDGRCVFGKDLAWKATWEPVPGADLVWTPQEGLYENNEACGWFVQPAPVPE